jgi:hypothetical protein
MTDESKAILGRYAPQDDGPHITVRLLNFPLQLFVKSRQRHDELIREFALLALSPPRDRPGHSVPKSLLDLIDTLGVRYAGVGDRTDAVRDAAVAAGEESMDLTYEVPSSVGPAMRGLHDLMERADEFCRDGQLLTLAPVPVEREFRLWFLQEFIDQAAGKPPTPWDGPLDADI